MVYNSVKSTNIIESGQNIIPGTIDMKLILESRNLYIRDHLSY
jgi:hypothetical protein